MAQRPPVTYPVLTITPDTGGGGGGEWVTGQIFDPNGSAVTTGDGKAWLTIPAMLDGRSIASIAATLTTVSSSGVVTVQMARIRGGTPVDVLSTPVTIDANELTSYTAAAASVVNPANDDIAVGDMWRVDIDMAGTGAKGLQVIVEVN